MLPADQPNAVHVALFWVLFDDGDAIYPDVIHDGGRFLQRTDNADYAGTARRPRPRFFEIIQACKPSAAVISITDFIVAAVEAMPHGPSMVIFELLRNIGGFSVPGRGGVLMEV